MAKKKRKKGQRPAAAYSEAVESEELKEQAEISSKKAQSHAQTDEDVPGWVNSVTDWFMTRPIAQRVLAFVTDYILCGVLCLIPLVVPYYWMNGGALLYDVADYTKIGLSLPVVGLIVLVACAISWWYYVIIPTRVWTGQTPGKRLAGIEVVTVDGEVAGIKTLTIRWAVMFFLEILFMMATSFALQFFDMVLPGIVMAGWRYVGMAASVFSVFATWLDRYHLSLHDRIARTWVYS